MSGSYAEYALALLFFAILSVILTNFIAFNISTQLFVSGPGDATAGFLWLNFADPGLDPFLSRTTIVNYPFGEKMGGATFITYLALWLPIRVVSYLFGPVAGINIIMFGGLIGGGLAGYWLVKRLTSSVGVALFAGLAIAFVPYNLYKSSSHIAYIFTAVFVFIVASFMALWVRPTKKRGVLFGATIALAFYTDGYYLLLASVTVAGLIGAGALYSIIRKVNWKHYQERIISLLIALVTLLILCMPIFSVRLLQGDEIKNTLDSARSDIRSELVAYQSKIMDFILPSVTNPLFEATGQNVILDDYKNLRSNPTESMNYIGFVVVTLAAIGSTLVLVWLFARRHSSLGRVESSTVNVYMLFTCIVVMTTPIFLSFMMSPSTVIAGHVVYLPGQFFIDHNIALWRVMSRFFVPMHVILALYAAFTLWILLRIHKVVWRNKTLRVAIAAVVSLLLMVEYSTAVYRPSFDFNKAPEAYQWLSRQKGIKTVAEFPLVDPLDSHTTRYVTYQIVHRKNLVNFKEPSDKRLANVLGSINNPEAIDFAYQRGAQAIITHDTKCEQSVSWGKLVHSSKDMPTGTICVYELNTPVTADKVFAVYGNGFKYYPNAPEGVLPFASFDKLRSTLSIREHSLSGRAKGATTLSAQIHDHHNDKVNGRWFIEQGGVVLAQGEIQNSSANIHATVDASKDVVFRLEANPGSLLRPNDLKIDSLVVTSS